ncbi:MAG TPA: TonB-dependent receptor, partial [bacterium]|nr:TonB-dependent receptor [bacterium]
MFNRKLTALTSVLALAFTLSATSCGKKPSSAPSADTTAPAGEKPAGEKTEAAAPAAPAAGTGSIKGKVSFSGTAPEMPALKREADPFCAKTPMKDEEVVVNSNGTLKNVAVTVQGAPAAVPEGEVHSEIDQTNCMYTPRVVTAAFDQNIKIVNSDPILHNVHTYADAKTLFNRAQPKGSPAIEKKFVKDDGSVVKFKCDVHPWMTGWLVLNDNGLNAV